MRLGVAIASAPAAGALVGAALVAGCSGCSAEERLDPVATSGGGATGSVAPSPAQSTGTGGTAATSTSGAAGAGGCPPQPVPDWVPDGWLAYTDWSCDCPFYVPGSKEVFPPPILWEPCPVSPGGIACQSMVVNWSNTDTPISATSRVHAHDNKVILSIQRNVTVSSQKHHVHVSVEVDGPVRSALMLIGSAVPGSWPSCSVGMQDANEGRVILAARGHVAGGSKESNHRGALGGSIDALQPTVLMHTQSDYPFSDGWACGASMIARVTGPFVMYAYPWDMSREFFVSSQATDPEKLDFSHLLIRADALFWQTADQYRSGLNIWTQERGAAPFVRYVGDGTRAAGNLGTDGIQLVWTEGEGKLPSQKTYEFPTRNIMTAPFVTDPALLQPKRLRSDPIISLSVHSFHVACGLAARGGLTQPIVVVRTSDGWSWLLPPSIDGFEPNTVIGVSCEHVYLDGFFGGRLNIARIKLDSLGAGVAPD
jgi:hypothetical protein